jgi:uncharacterized protein YkwD
MTSTRRRTTRTLATAAATAVLSGGLVLVPAVASAAPEDCAYMGYGSYPDQLGLQLDASEQWVADNINAYRAQNGLAALTISEQLRRPTMWGSLDSATRNYDADTSNDDPSNVSHTDSRGMGIAQRADYCGRYVGLIGEIKYWGEGGTADNPYYFGSGPAALEAWKRSAPHNELMLRGDFTTFGVGFAYQGHNAESGYWTVMFGDH